jgi:hypothetical protein
MTLPVILIIIAILVIAVAEAGSPKELVMHQA